MSRLHRLLSLSATILLLVTATTAWSAPKELVITDEIQLALGDAFMADGEYYRAVTEYMKFLYLFPESEHKAYALQQLGLANYHGGEYAQAISYFAQVRATYAEEFFQSAAFFEGVCYEKIQQPDKARDAFDRAFFFDQSSGEAAAALTGKLLNRLHQDDVAAARKVLQQYVALQPRPARSEEAERALTLLDQYEATPRKSPALAGTMSAVLPGSGYVYAGRSKDGIMSLLINGLFIAGTVAAIEDENYAVAGIVGGIGLPFYLGNIYGSANAAHKWNVSLRKDLHQEMGVMLDYRF